MVLKIFDIENMLYLRDPYFLMQYCCILTYNSVAFNSFLKSKKYLNAILLYLEIQQYCIELFLYIKRIIQCKIVVSSLAIVLH